MLARPGLPSFDYIRASSPEEVVALLQEHGGAASLLMGGTDLFVHMRDGAVRPKVVVDVKGLAGLQQISYDEQGGLTVGAAVTMNRLVAHPAVGAHYPLLAEAASSVASYQLRNRATLGGNLCNASPCADTSPAVVALEGRLCLRGPSGERELPAERFFLGPGQTALGAEEFLTAIRFPVPPAGSAGCYLKLGRCKAGDLALVGVAALGFPDPSAASGYRFRLVLGSVAPVPLRAVAAEEVLAAGPLNQHTLALAAEKGMEAASPVSDVRSGAEYQKEMVRTLTLRGLTQVWKQLNTQHAIRST